jgi:hypothetical protein
LKPETAARPQVSPVVNAAAGSSISKWAKGELFNLVDIDPAAGNYVEGTAIKQSRPW